MAKLFRLACSIEAYLNNPDKTRRPPKPTWLAEDNRENATRNQAHSFNYWTKIYWATPPWITADMIDKMRDIYTSATAAQHIDHIVPLNGTLASGLHVPWNLQRIPAKTNLQKSNTWWPDHPYENHALFGPLETTHQMRLAL